MADILEHLREREFALRHVIRAANPHIDQQSRECAQAALAEVVDAIDVAISQVLHVVVWDESARLFACERSAKEYRSFLIEHHGLRQRDILLLQRTPLDLSAARDAVIHELECMSDGPEPVREAGPRARPETL